MFLMNRLAHKKNSDVRVGQTVYRVGPGGYICYQDDEKTPMDVPEVDATKLVQGRAWDVLDWDPLDPANEKRFSGPAGYPEGKPGVGRPPRSMEQLKADYGLTDEKAKASPVPRSQLPPQQIGTATSKDGSTGLSGVEQAPPEDASLSKSVQADQTSEAADITSQRARGETEALPIPSSPEATDIEDVTPSTLVLPSDDLPVAAYPKVPVEGQHWPDPTSEMSVVYLKRMADAYGIKYRKNIKSNTLATKLEKVIYEPALD